MFSCCGSVCLLVLLGALLVFGSPVHVVTENLAKTHDAIADVLVSGLWRPTGIHCRSSVASLAA